MLHCYFILLSFDAFPFKDIILNCISCFWFCSKCIAYGGSFKKKNVEIGRQLFHDIYNFLYKISFLCDNCKPIFITILYPFSPYLTHLNAFFSSFCHWCLFDIRTYPHVLVAHFWWGGSNKRSFQGGVSRSLCLVRKSSPLLQEVVKKSLSSKIPARTKRLKTENNN